MVACDMKDWMVMFAVSLVEVIDKGDSDKNAVVSGYKQYLQHLSEQSKPPMEINSESVELGAKWVAPMVLDKETSTKEAQWKEPLEITDEPIVNGMWEPPTTSIKE